MECKQSGIGIIFSLIVYYYNSLWAAMCFHTLWNYTQNIIFGLPNSGAVSEYSIFKLEAASATSGFFYDVGFGVEGSIGSTLVLAVVLAAILFIAIPTGAAKFFHFITDDPVFLNLMEGFLRLVIFLGYIWGIVGMFLAVPLLSVLQIICANVDATRPIAMLISSGRSYKRQSHLGRETREKKRAARKGGNYEDFSDDIMFPDKK